MKRRTVPLKTLLVLVGILAVAATASLSVASAKTRKPVAVPPDAVLTWNTNTVNAVRASTPTKVQTDGMVYMSYVQAAVYDAVTKLEGRYEPYHDFTFTVVPGASVQAAVAAAARTTLDYYLPDQQPTVDAEYNAYLATLTGDVADGVAVGEAAANDIIALPHRRRPQRGDAELRAGSGRSCPGSGSCSRARRCRRRGSRRCVRSCSSRPRSSGPSRRRRSTSHAVREGPERDRGLRRAQQHRPHPGADGDRVLLGREQHQPVQPDDAERRRAARHGSRRRRASARDGGDRHDRRRDRLLRLEVLLPVLAADHGDPERRQGRQPRHDRRPDLAVAAGGAGPPRVPVPARLLHRRLQRRARGGAAHASTSTSPCREDRTEARVLTTTQHFDTVDDIQNQVVDARVWLGFHFRNSVEQGEKLGNDVADWELKRYFKPVQP